VYSNQQSAISFQQGKSETLFTVFLSCQKASSFERPSPGSIRENAKLTADR
jgi:hypothetical protein